MTIALEGMRKSRRVGIVVRFVTDYNVPLYKLIAEDPSLEVRLFCMKYGKRAGNFGVREAVRELGDLAVGYRRGGIAARIESALRVALPCMRLVSAVRQWKPEVVLMEGLSNVGSAATLLGLSYRDSVPYVWWSLGRPPGEAQSARNVLGDVVQRWCVQRCRSVVAYSSHGAAYFRRLRIPAESIVVGYNTIDERRIFSELVGQRKRAQALRHCLGITTEPVGVFCGTLKPGKRVDVLIRAFASARMRLRVSNPRLLIVGDGPDRQALERLAEEEGVSDAVAFVGRQDENVGAYFLVADFSVLPGLGGLAINFSFAWGVPVLCGPADGCEKDLVRSGHTGLLLDSVTVESLSNALVVMLRDRSGCREMGARAQDVVRNTVTLRNYSRQIRRALDLACGG